MSIKVLIVDDERLERLLIRKSFDWETEGFEIIGEAGSGDEALELVKMHQPDLVFTDINMPFMDGLEFATWMQLHYPTTRVVIITGYRKFEYAQKAIHLGVKEFLLKPIQKEDLHDILARCQAEILAEIQNQNQMTELIQSKTKQDQLLYDHFLQRLLMNQVDLELEQATLKAYKLMHLLQGGRVINIKLSDTGCNETLIENILNLKEDLFKTIHRTFSNQIVIILGNETPERLSLFIQAIKQLTELELMISVGTFNEGLKGLQQSYRESVMVMTHNMLTHHLEPLDYETYVKNYRRDNEFELNTTELVFALENGLMDKVEVILNDYASQLLADKVLERDAMTLMSMNIVSLYLSVIHRKGKKLSHVFEAEQVFYDELASLGTLLQMTQFLVSTAGLIINVMVEKKEKKGSQLIEDSLLYIEEHLCDVDLSLKSIAASLFVNESYLSRTFKKEVGESVIGYITMKRIQKSIHLLQSTDLKVYEIAESIGIEDPHYFGICFKKQTGKTIKQYREMLYQ